MISVTIFYTRIFIVFRIFLLILQLEVHISKWPIEEASNLDSEDAVVVAAELAQLEIVQLDVEDAEAAVDVVDAEEGENTVFDIITTKIIAEPDAEERRRPNGLQSPSSVDSSRRRRSLHSRRSTSTPSQSRSLK